MTGFLPKSTFRYGWCLTDHKDGTTIRRAYRSTDYMNDEPYASLARQMIRQLGLPHPAHEEIFRGTHHDLLFLDSHGVVLRIGPLDVEDLMNPGILQPLGWLEDRKNLIDGKIPFTIAIYPGIEQRRNYSGLNEVSLYSFLISSEQSPDDLSINNTGMIRVLDAKGKEAAVPVLLDMDNRFNRSSRELSYRRSRCLKIMERRFENKADILSCTLQAVFNGINNMDLWQRAFEAHQPLRRLFWKAFKDMNSLADAPDPAALNAFWRTCARVTNTPKNVSLPAWKAHLNKKGMPVFTRRDVNVPNLVLYRQWTKEEVDKIVRPIQQSEKIKSAVHKAHVRQRRINKPAAAAGCKP